MPDYFFITGAARSGTTLIDKLCHNLPGTVAASQPYHQWYVDVRDAFFSAHPDFLEPLPLFHHFPADPGWHKAFSEYLSTTQLDEQRALTLAMNATSGKGQSTPGLSTVLRAPVTSFFSLWRQLHDALPPALNQDNASRIGSKEIYCEDYVPFLIDNGVRCIHSIRDIRDVITSMNYGSYREATRLPYPLLLNIRNWRKSVATALAFRNNPRVKVVRYEDVVKEPATALRQLAEFLEVPLAGLPELEALRDQQGGTWQGNSSFGASASISTRSVGRWEDALSVELVSLVEYLAGPELLALGYSLSKGPVDGKAAFDQWQSADLDTRPEYRVGNELNQENLALEMERLAQLLRSGSADDEKWFLYADAARALRAAWMAFKQ